MKRKAITENVKRKLWAESMGYCMNPACKEKLFINNGDIIEQAHIEAYYETLDNSYDNLIILCPNCHKKFDKIGFFTKSDVKEWKKIRRKELETFFSVKYTSFNELKESVVPILNQNNNIYNNYYLTGNKNLWKKFEPQLLENNEKLKLIFEKNLNLFQHHKVKEYSNLVVIQNFLTHVDEFKNTRLDIEKNRSVLFPQEIYSIFGINPIKGNILPNTESLEELIKIMRKEKTLEDVVLGVDNPYILKKDGGKILLNDVPRIRQIYHNNNCFRRVGVRLDSLNFALTYLRSRGINFEYKNLNKLRKIIVNDTIIEFVYEYCLSKAFLYNMSPKPNDVIVNLHNWNGENCISKEAREVAKIFDVTLLTMKEFYMYVNKFK